ncbi:MAG: Ig-like domain-containing protein, partial [Mycetocola sp.]
MLTDLVSHPGVAHTEQPKTPVACPKAPFKVDIVDEEAFIHSADRCDRVKREERTGANEKVALDNLAWPAEQFSARRKSHGDERRNLPSSCVVELWADGGDAAPATVTLDVGARPALSSTPSADVTLGGALTDTVTLSARFEPTPGATVEFRLFRGEDCTGTPVFTSTATLDAGGSATSEPFTPTAPGAYRWQATYSGDTGNLAATGTCDAVNVREPAVLPAERKPDAPAAGTCGDPVVLLDVSPVGPQARVSGIARRELAGQTVTIQRAGKAVGTATVGPDGAFTALVAGPTAADAKPVTYMAWLGGKHSRAFRYDRYLRITKRAGLTISGKLALKRVPKTVTLTRVNVCSGKRVG